jgi:hypothetical protein
LRVLNLTRALAACSLVAASFASAASQTRAGETPAATPPQTATRQSAPTADEDFELNIDVRRIRESDFHAETAVEAGDPSGLLLKVGVALGARDIEVLLQGVRGRVRFRASLAPVLRMLDARRGAAHRAPETSP